MTILGCAGLAVAALTVLCADGSTGWEWHSEKPFGGQLPHLRIDALSAMFLMLVAVVGAAGAVYGYEYWGDRDHSASAARGCFWWNILLAAMAAVLTLSNGLHFLIAWETFALAGYFLVTLDQGVPARRAGWLYLAASHAGTLALFAFFAALAAAHGTWDLGPMREESLPNSLFWLMLFGFGMKAGFMPCHIWLPSAHANAPSHVSAVMSGVAIKMGIYGIFRFCGWLPTPGGAGNVLVLIGAVTAVAGIAMAFMQTDLKRVLAYCSVENIGIILAGLGAAMLASEKKAAWSALALGGSLLHVWNHGLFKSLLFFGAGSVLHATGTREMSQLGGLWRIMPWTAGTTLVGILSVSALPPLNGFVSEWLLYRSFFGLAIEVREYSGVLGALGLAVGGAVALAAFVKFGSMIFLGTARSDAASSAHECGTLMRGVLVTLALLCVLVGGLAALLWAPAARAAAAWAGQTPSLAGNPLAPLGIAQPVVMLTAILAVALVARAAAKNGLRRTETWSCGSYVNTPRLQYSAASFSGILGDWLALLFRPNLFKLRPHGLFPMNARSLARWRDTILSRAVAPCAHMIRRASKFAIHLQHGRLQFYIIYVAVGIALVSLCAALIELILY